MAKLDICIHCGLPEPEHCIFEPAIVPEGCQCDPVEWENPGNLPPICDNFEELGRTGLCKNCEHLRECHHG